MWARQYRPTLSGRDDIHGGDSRRFVSPLDLLRDDILTLALISRDDASRLYIDCLEISVGVYADYHF